MNSFLKYSGVFIAGIFVSLIISAILVGNMQKELGGVYSQSVRDFSNGGITSTGAAYSSPATTTVSLTSTNTAKGGCIQMETTNGSTSRIYLAGTTTVLRVEEGTCQ